MKSEESVTTSFLNACRACMAIPGSHSIFSSSEDIKYSITNIPEMMIAVSRTDVTQNDGLPDKICEICLDSLEKAFQFQKMCLDSYVKMKNMLNCSSTQNIQNDILNIEIKSENEDVFDLPESGNNQRIDVECTIEHVNVNLINNTDFNYEEAINSDEIPVNVNHITLSQNCKKKSPKKTNPQTSDMHKCDVCGKKFDEIDRFTVHLKIHDPRGRPYECTVCKKYFKREGHLDRHRSTQHGELSMKQVNCSSSLSLKYIKCPKCDKTFDKQQALSSHMRVHSDRKFHCFICQEEFLKLYLLRKHVKCHKDTDQSQCNMCQKSFTSSAELIEHISRCNCAKVNSCNTCNKAFRRFEELKSHLRVHSSERQFLCSECGKTFKNSSGLRFHLMLHTGLKPFECTECGKKFPTKGARTAHMIIHSNIKRFSCDTCGKLFTHSNALVIHKRIHTGEKPFACKLCDLRFYSSGKLKRHMRTHTGEKPFTCKFCNRGFPRKDNLTKHIEVHTENQDFPISL